MCSIFHHGSFEIIALIVILRLHYTICDKEKKISQKLETMRLSSILPPKSANLVFNDDSEQAVFLQEKIYTVYIKRLHVHHVKTVFRTPLSSKVLVEV